MSVTRASSIPNAHLLIGGDLNFPGWDWPSSSLKTKTPCPDLHNKLMDIINDHGLEQMVMFPTRLDNTLDLLITNSPELIPRIEPVPGLSDHHIVYAEISISIHRKRPVPRVIPLYHKANWTGLREAVKESAVRIQEMSTREDASCQGLWDCFKSELLSSVQEFVPHRKTSSNKNHQPWITPEIRLLMNRRDRAYRKWKKSGSQKLHEEVKKRRRIAQRQTRRAYWNYVNSTLTEEEPSEHAPKYKRFWSYIKNQKSSSAGVAPIKVNGILRSDPKGKAEALNTHFQSVFGDGKTYTPDEFAAKSNMEDRDIPPLNDIDITVEGVKNILKKLNPRKATGPDGISARVLRELAEEVAPSLTLIYRSSISSGSVPSDWKSALVTPIFKKGEHYDPANYRPVSLTCIACKVMEHIVVSSTMGHLERNNILNPRQHGFRRQRSCETQLLELVDDLVDNMEAGLQTDILVMDLAKAFDRVNHSLLLHKLRRCGVQGNVNRWIQGFLSERRQAVVVEGAQSSYVDVRSGVPQGSVLGPCLFLVYINDLPDTLTSLARLFADDTAVYRKVTSLDDQTQLQQDLDRLAAWENSWDMQFHPGKCTTLPVTRRRTTLTYPYQLHGETLETVASTKYLGVTLQKDVSWDRHVDAITAKASKTLGFLRRNLKIASTELREKAYIVFVRPILEYASSVWDPHTERNINKLEAVQRRAARFVLNRYHNTSSVSAMIDRLGWPTLQERRKTARLCMFQKIVTDQVQVEHSKLQAAPSRTRRRQGTPYKQIQCRTDYRRFSFFPRTIKDWNAMPASTTPINDLDSTTLSSAE
jgi:hypothetical protein